MIIRKLLLLPFWVPGEGKKTRFFPALRGRPRGMMMQMPMLILRMMTPDTAGAQILRMNPTRTALPQKPPRTSIVPMCACSSGVLSEPPKRSMMPSTA